MTTVATKRALDLISSKKFNHNILYLLNCISLNNLKQYMLYFNVLVLFLFHIQNTYTTYIRLERKLFTNTIYVY